MAWRLVGPLVLAAVGARAGLPAGLPQSEASRHDAVATNVYSKGLEAHGIGAFQAFHLAPELLEERHGRHRRGRRTAHRGKVEPLQVAISAHGKSLDLRLHAAEHEIFHPKFTHAHIIGNGSVTKLKVDTTAFYHGRVLEEMDAYLSMFVDVDHVLVGTIFTPEDDYYVERADKYGLDSATYTNIIYKGSDMIEPNSSQSFEGTYYSKMLAKQEEIERQRAANGHDTSIRARQRRDWNATANGDTCETLLIADNLYRIKKGGDTRTVTMEMISLLDSSSLIYRFTQFNPHGESPPPSLGVAKLAVKQVEVYTDDSNALAGDVSCEDGEFCAQAYLDKLTTMRDFNDYCLVHAFTNHDFTGGILGLAWVGRAGSNGAGICAGHYGGRSMNTGISTATNFGAEVSRQVQVITLAHEFGHNFGSNHDTDDASGGTCAPGGVDGNYIMYLKATDGDKANNDKFSDCSTGSMNGVISSNSGCFRTRPTVQCGLTLMAEGRCGNTILEVGETCECDDATLTTQGNCNCDTCEVITGQCIPAGDPNGDPCCTSDKTLMGLSLAETMQKYRSAFIGAANGTYTTVADGLEAEMMYPNGTPVEGCGITPDCLHKRYCIADERFVPYKGQVYGSCPQADLVINMLGANNTDATAEANGYDVCYNFTIDSEDKPPVPSGPEKYRAKNMQSCQKLGELMVAADVPASNCWLFHKSNDETCNSDASLCRYNGCTGSICDKFSTININNGTNTIDADNKATPCSLRTSDTCKIACRFASPSNQADVTLCTKLDNASIMAHYPNVNIGGLGAAAAERNLPPGRSCVFEGEAGGGKCNAAGTCEEYKEDIGDSLDPDKIASWMKDNWDIVLIFLAVFIIIVVLLKCTYHKKKKPIRRALKNAHARVTKTLNPKGNPSRPGNARTGQFGKGGATILTTQMRNDMRKVIKKEEQFMRLQAFFPNTDDAKLKSVQNKFTTEKEMVQRLLRSNEGILIPTGNVLLD